jgi:Divergent InlB B-repeat domain
VNYSITNLPSWLTASSTSGTATTSATTVTFAINSSANNLTPGTYVNSINFNSTTNNQQGNTTLTATLTVNPPAPVLQVTPATNIVASGPKGGPFSPSSFSYFLRTSRGSANYSITDVPSWLTVSSTSGTATPSATTLAFKINSSAKNLAPGTYANSINFNNTTNNQGNTTVTATLTVTTGNSGTYMIAASALPSTGGKVSGAGTFAAGSLRTVTATPNRGYTFVHWTENGSVVSTSKSYTFTLDTNRNLVADFQGNSRSGPSISAGLEGITAAPHRPPK